MSNCNGYAFFNTQRENKISLRCRSFIAVIKFLILHCPPLVHYKKHRVSTGDYYNKSHYFIQIDVKTLKIKFGITQPSSASWFWWPGVVIVLECALNATLLCLCARHIKGYEKCLIKITNYLNVLKLKQISTTFLASECSSELFLLFISIFHKINGCV